MSHFQQFSSSFSLRTRDEQTICDEVWNMDLTHLGELIISVACFLVCIGQKNSVSKALFSLIVCIKMVFQDQHTLPKWNILSLLCMSKQLDRIFHFVRVCWSWKTITYIWAERTRPWRQNFSGQYRHTERERVHIIRLWGKTMFWSSQFQNWLAIIMMFGYGNWIW